MFTAWARWILVDPLGPYGHLYSLLYGPGVIQPPMQPCRMLFWPMSLYGFSISTRLRYQSFDNGLEDEPRVGTLIRRSLIALLSNQSNTGGTKLFNHLLHYLMFQLRKSLDMALLFHHCAVCFKILWNKIFQVWFYGCCFYLLCSYFHQFSAQVVFSQVVLFTNG